MEFCLHCYFCVCVCVLCVEPFKMEHLLHAIVTFSRMQKILQQIWFTSDCLYKPKINILLLKMCATFVVNAKYYLKMELSLFLVSYVYTFTNTFQPHLRSSIAPFCMCLFFALSGDLFFSRFEAKVHGVRCEVNEIGRSSEK